MTVRDVKAKNWDAEVQQSDTIVLVEFWHPRCPWCRQMIPIYEEISNEYPSRMKFMRLNVLESQDNRQFAMSLGVRGTPTFIFFCEGQPVGSAVGLQTKEQLSQVIEDMLIKHQECLIQSSRLRTES